MFVHHVFFYLNNPDSSADRDALVAGLQTLTSIEVVKLAHIGKVADTYRAVIDRSYSISWLMLFETKADQDIYQDHPVHHTFVKDCAHLWEKVVIYDSDDV
ncbi:Dabb family protein [Runella sp.]|uniref:Dabb family protein n=1 Tax=Runella sp. TaxID=1960881 RepID=UPI003D0C47CB